MLCFCCVALSFSAPLSMDYHEQINYMCSDVVNVPTHKLEVYIISSRKELIKCRLWFYLNTRAKQSTGNKLDYNLVMSGCNHSCFVYYCVITATPHNISGINRTHTKTGGMWLGKLTVCVDGTHPVY